MIGRGTEEAKVLMPTDVRAAGEVVRTRCGGGIYVVPDHPLSEAALRVLDKIGRDGVERLWTWVCKREGMEGGESFPWRRLYPPVYYSGPTDGSYVASCADFDVGASLIFLSRELLAWFSAGIEKPLPVTSCCGIPHGYRRLSAAFVLGLPVPVEPRHGPCVCRLTWRIVGERKRGITRAEYPIVLTLEREERRHGATPWARELAVALGASGLFDHIDGDGW